MKTRVQTAAEKKSFGCGIFMSLLTCLLIATVFSSGCQTYKVEAFGVAKKKLQKNSTFVVVVRYDEKALEKQDAKRLRKMTERALTKKGLVLVENKETADTVVIVRCIIGPPHKRKKTEYISKPDPEVYAEEPYTDSEFAVVNWNPSETAVEVEYTVYTKCLVMRGFPGKKHSGNVTKPKELWRVEVRDTNEVGELKTMMPYLVIAATKYAGKTIDGSKNVRIRINGKKVRDLEAAAE